MVIPLNDKTAGHAGTRGAINDLLTSPELSTAEKGSAAYPEEVAAHCARSSGELAGKAQPLLGDSGYLLA